MTAWDWLLLWSGVGRTEVSGLWKETFCSVATENKGNIKLTDNLTRTMAGARSHCCAVSKDRNEWNSKGVKLPSNLNFEKLCYNMLIRLLEFIKLTPGLPPSLPSYFHIHRPLKRNKQMWLKTASLGTLSVTHHPPIPNLLSVIWKVINLIAWYFLSGEFAFSQLSLL